MTGTDDVKAAVIAAHGLESAAVLGARHGLTRNQVIGLWHRRARDTPEELAKAAARATAAESGQAPFTPETASFTGQAGAAWRAILAAVDAGATAAAIRSAMYPHGGEPPSSPFVVYEVIRRLRHNTEPHGFTVALIKAKPSRWRILRLSEDRSQATHPGDAGPAAEAPVRRPAAATPVTLERPAVAAPSGDGRGDAVDLPEVSRWLASAAPPVTFSGTARAVMELGHRECRWPVGEPGAQSFRFCCAAVRDDGRLYCPEHRRVASARTESARRAA